MTRRQHRGEIRTPDGLRPGSTGISMIPQTMRSTDHPGSKRWFIHISPPPRRSQVPFPAPYQKTLPPQLKIRARLPQADPMSPQDRWDRYTLGGTLTRLTPAQDRRFRHKHGRRVRDVYVYHLPR